MEWPIEKFWTVLNIINGADEYKAKMKATPQANG
jgi:hypothetical protein